MTPVIIDTLGCSRGAWPKKASKSVSSAICSSRVADGTHGRSVRGLAVELGGADWRTLAPWFLDVHADAFGVMTAAAFRHFLPAALCHALGPGSDVDLKWHLVARLHDLSSDRESARARISTFSAPERAAIAAFIRFMVAERGPDAAETEAIALWSPHVRHLG